MPIDFWTTVTHLGNSTLLIPAALVLALWLFGARQWQLALAWLVSFCAAVGLVLFSKLAFLGWGLGYAAIDFTGFSGHSTVSTSVFTMGAWLVVADRSARARWLAVGLGLLVGVLVSVSRLVLETHSVSEVVAGFTLGAAAALVPIAWVRRRTPPVRQRWVPMALAFSLGLAPQAGRPAEAHGLVVQIALKASGRTDVYHRYMLHDSAP